MQAQEAQKAAVCSLQACITTAVQAGRAGTAGAAAEQMAACLGRSDAQGAAEAILMAQSAHTVGDMEALFQDAAAPQAWEQLLLQLRDHLEVNPALTASHQRLQTKLQQETCMGPRLALTPPVLDILKAIPATTCIISLHLSSEHSSVLYCAVLRGQQTSETGPAGKTKAAKQVIKETFQSITAAAEAKPDAVEPAMLAQVPLPRGALAAVAAQLKQYTAAREQHLLAVADQATTAASIVATEDTPAQQWQGVLDSLAALLGPAAPLLSAPPAAQDSKGGSQGCPVLLLLDAQLVDLPFEWLPQLKSASAVVRDFSLHVHHSRMTVASSGRQGVAIKQLSYIVDPCMEHAPPPPLTPPVSTPAKPGPKSTKPLPANTPAEKASRSLVQAFQQDVLPAIGKEWSGITGSASFMPTEAQYAQLLRRAVGVVYCGMGPVMQYVPAAVLAQADLRACEVAVLLDTGHTTKSDR
ncbi:Cilia and flagella associated protein 46 [Trebouxia sp. C0010 RCD-2024]